MAHVVDYKDFEQVLQRLELVEADNRFLKGLLLGQRSLSRKQACAALNVSSSTIERLTKSGVLACTYEGTKPLYPVDSIRAYMTGKKIDVATADQRLIAAVSA